MENNNIPTPIQKITIEEDQRLQFLKEWKRLFEDLDPQVTAFINKKDKLFKKKLEEKYHGIKMEHFIYSHAQIIINLGADVRESYLIGTSYDNMFSNIDILKDPLVDEGFLCEPETKKWGEYYLIINEQIKEKRKEIPNPFLEIR